MSNVVIFQFWNVNAQKELEFHTCIFERDKTRQELHEDRMKRMDDLLG